MVESYFPILVMGVFAGVVAGGMCLLARLVGPRHGTAQKAGPYECGMWPVGDARRRFAVKFHVVAMLFILFDVELAFFYPWAVLFRDLRLFGLIEMGIFAGILVGAYVYVWRAGGFEWD